MRKIQTVLYGFPTFFSVRWFGILVVFLIIVLWSLNHGFNFSKQCTDNGSVLCNKKFSSKYGWIKKFLTKKQHVIQIFDFSVVFEINWVTRLVRDYYLQTIPSDFVDFGKIEFNFQWKTQSALFSWICFNSQLRK